MLQLYLVVRLAGPDSGRRVEADEVNGRVHHGVLVDGVNDLALQRG